MSANEDLSAREREIVRLVATGAGNKQIAQQLNISSNTVKVHLRNIFAKTNVTTRTELTVYAIREGLVQVDGATREASGESETIASGEGRPEAPRSASATRLARRYGWPVRGLIALSTVIIAVLAATNILPVLPRPAASTVTPDVSRWQVKASLPTARSGFAVATYENQIYVIGGKTVEAVTSALERYNPVSDAWTTLEPKPVAVTDVSAVVIGGRIY